MERVFDLFLWSVAGALCLALVGAPFGAIARAVAQRDGRVADPTLAQAIGNGLLAGAGVFACFGLVMGAAIGWLNEDVANGFRVLQKFVMGTALLTASATAFAGLGYFCVWLGMRGTGILLALGIGVAPAGWLAPSLGFSVAAGRFVQVITALLGTTTVLAIRLRSPAGQDAFEPWRDSPDSKESPSKWEPPKNYCDDMD